MGLAARFIFRASFWNKYFEPFRDIFWLLLGSLHDKDNGGDIFVQ